ncbi:MAG: ATP synthase F1 subunit delta [Candidatus Dormibacter sp.]|uniref:ATP synthase F1 subunit delta n=1 Tax=Candidatus Dormibacter sp. TaxID=2973982 RepID=UPI003D9BC043
MTDALVDGYATAIFEVARAEGVLDEVEDQLFRFARVLDSSNELRTTITDDALPPERRQGIVEDLLGGRALPLTSTLGAFVVGAGRARELPAIIDLVVERAAAARRQVVAEVRSSIPLDDDQRRRLAHALSSNLGKQVEVKVVVDPAVLGGLSAKVGDTVIDGTVRHRLELLRESL